MNTKVVIWGCGSVGRYTMHFIGKERIDYFCDNNPNVCGSTIGSISVINYESLLKMYRESQVLLIIGVNTTNNNQEAVIAQCESDGITDYIIAEMLPGIDCASHISDKDWINCFQYSKRQEYYIKFLQKKLAHAQGQIEYFKKHASISHMSPAVGKLRQEQLDGVREASTVLDFLKNNLPSFKCWITSGTLIGKMRHNGFIPWDNDLDFGVMREDVYKLIDFFRKYSTVYISGNDLPVLKTTFVEMQQKAIQDVAKEFKGKYFLCYYPSYMRIYIMYNTKLITALELFTFDYYSNDLSIQKYQKYVSNGFMMKKALPSYKEIFDWCYDQIRNSGIVSKNPTNKILPGIDSFSYAGLWTIQKFLAPNVIFPLHEVEFEGARFFSVNQPETYMEHEYPDWRNFPHDIGYYD